MVLARVGRVSDNQFSQIWSSMETRFQRVMQLSNSISNVAKHIRQILLSEMTAEHRPLKPLRHVREHIPAQMYQI